MGSSNPGDSKVFIFDTETNQMKYAGEGGDISSFYNVQNSVVKVKENKVIALVRSNDGYPTIIEFNKGDTHATRLAKYN